MMRWLVLAFCLLASPVVAVQPGEILADPALEARARDISQGLRCLVCQNENIDDSNASLAHDLRVLVRDRLTAGDSNAEVVDFIVDRYGEFVLLEPRVTGSTIALWLAGPAMLILGVAIALTYARRRGRASPEEARLSDAEATRLRDIMNE